MRNQIPETSFLVFRQANHVYRQLKQTPHGPVYKMGQMIVHPPRRDSEGNDIYKFPVIDVNADYSKLGKNQTRGAA